MRLLEHSLSTPEENLALDETLLEQAEAACQAGDESSAPSWELLRLWEMPSLCVILGRSSDYPLEVHHPHITEDRIPCLRRASGGSTVLAGSGCLMYSVLLSYASRPHLRMLDAAHREVMQNLQKALRPQFPDVVMQGTCDLTWNGKKFSGNALRCKRHFLLYHGTILYGFPLPLISRYLLEPPRQPDYRLKREHSEFLSNIPLDLGPFRSELADVWGAHSPPFPIDSTLYNHLLSNRYRNPAWHRVSSSCSNDTPPMSSSFSSPS